MARIYCPQCKCKMKIPACILEAKVRCLSCRYVFSTKFQDAFLSPRIPAHPTPEERVPEAPPRLTSPHSCQHCGSSLAHLTGRTSATIVCSACGNKTSVYAVLHRCPACRQLLESPARMVGAQIACPACRKQLPVPRDTLRQKAPEGSEEFWFGCYCPSCEEEVAIREQDVGSYAVCPHCLVPFDVPHEGHYLEGREPRETPDPLDSLQDIKTVVCPECRTRSPARTASCPQCGTPTPSPSPW